MKNDDFNIFQYLHRLMIAAFCIAATHEMCVIILFSMTIIMFHIRTVATVYATQANKHAYLSH